MGIRARDLDGIAVAKGPGSYTGIRVAAAAAKCISFALEKPLVGICTLDENRNCMGCLRTLEEIRGWALLNPEAQWALVEELNQRRERQMLDSKD